MGGEATWMAGAGRTLLELSNNAAVYSRGGDSTPVDAALSLKLAPSSPDGAFFCRYHCTSVSVRRRRYSAWRALRPPSRESGCRRHRRPYGRL